MMNDARSTRTDPMPKIQETIPDHLQAQAEAARAWFSENQARAASLASRR